MNEDEELIEICVYLSFGLAIFILILRYLPLS